MVATSQSRHVLKIFLCILMQPHCMDVHLFILIQKVTIDNIRDWSILWEIWSPETSTIIHFFFMIRNMEWIINNFPISHGNVYDWCILWTLCWHSTSFIFFCPEFVCYELEIAVFSCLTWIISYEVFVDSIFAFWSIKYNVLYLVRTTCRLINIKGYPICWFFLWKTARATIWHYAMNI